MRHAKQRHRLNRFTSWRKSTLRSMARSLLISQRIVTTKVKAHAAAPFIAKLITLSKDDTIAHRRNAFKVLGEHQLVNSLFKEVAPLFKNRNSGYTRILSLGSRRGDGAELVIFELTEQKEKIKKPKKEKTETAAQIKETKEIKEKAAPKDEAAEARPRVATEVKAPHVKKPSKKFLGGLRQIFKKKSDSL